MLGLRAYAAADRGMVQVRERSVSGTDAGIESGHGRAHCPVLQPGNSDKPMQREAAYAETVAGRGTGTVQSHLLVFFETPLIVISA